jgi:hypothetical protein
MFCGLRPKADLPILELLPPPAIGQRRHRGPRASARSRRSASGLRGGHRPASTAMAGLSARPRPRPMPKSARGARQRSGGVEKYSSIASRQAPEQGSAASSPGPDSRISAAIYSAQLCRPRRGATRSPCSCNSTCEMSVRASRSSRLHAGQRRDGRGLHDGPTTTPSASTSKSSSFHSPDDREADARLRIRPGIPGLYLAILNLQPAHNDSAFSRCMPRDELALSPLGHPVGCCKVRTVAVMGGDPNAARPAAR